MNIEQINEYIQLSKSSAVMPYTSNMYLTMCTVDMKSTTD